MLKLTRPTQTTTELLMAMAWLAGLAVLCLWLAWHLYASGKSDALQAMAEGRAFVLTLTEDKISAPAPVANAKRMTLADSPDASAFPIKPMPPVIPPPVTPKQGEALIQLKGEMIEQTDVGPIPKISKDGENPWIVYARPFNYSGSSPVIAILVTNVGLSKETSDLALRLPPAVSLGLAVYGQEPKLWAEAARAVGHEIFIDLPLEPSGFPNDDPGPEALLTMNTVEDNAQHIKWALARASGAIGVDMAGNERFSINKQIAIPALMLIKERGLMAAIAPGGPVDAQDDVLKATLLPYARADIRLDDSPTHDDIMHQLVALENVAVRRGFAFGVCRAYPVTLKTLAEWQQTLEKKGIILAPVSALARKRFS